MIDDSYDLRTPEQVELAYDLAGLGSRGLARLLDGLIQGVLVMAIIFAFGLGGALMSTIGTRRLGIDADLLAILGIALLVLLVFGVIFGYDIFFEMAWNGQTPGKRAAGIRV